MYMSRLAAMKEFSFMKALSEQGLPVPEAIAQNRHTIVMGLVDAFPLRQISSVPDPAGLYSELMELVLRLAKLGLIHGDFNEFNILIKEEQEAEGDEGARLGLTTTDAQQQNTHAKLIPILIDFPQMVSIDHPNADFYFNRDVACIKRFFERRFHFVSDEAGPDFADAKAQLQENSAKRIDVEVEASGFSRKMAKELELYMKEVGVDGDHGNAAAEEGEDGGTSDESDAGGDDGEEAADAASLEPLETAARGSPGGPG
jgi:RIO kinase 2